MRERKCSRGCMNNVTNTDEQPRELVKSISYDQSEIIRNILELYVPNKTIDCDPTYCIGSFYKNTGITAPRFKFDIKPQLDDVVQADCRNLPIEDKSLDCIMFDPPFLATKGVSLEKNDANNRINKWYGVYDNEKELHRMYVDSMAEFYRILRNDGILIFKCQDKTSGRKQYYSHIFIQNEAVKLGFYPEDLFILLAKQRIVADWQAANQKHARKYHSYFWVFRKCRSKIYYV